MNKLEKLIRWHFRRSHFRPDRLCSITFLVYFKKDGKIFVEGEDMLGDEHKKCKGYKWIFEKIKQGYKLYAIYSVREWWWHKREYNPNGTDTDWYGRAYIEKYYYGYDEVVDFIENGIRARLRYSIDEYGNYIEHMKKNWELAEKLFKEVAI